MANRDSKLVINGIDFGIIGEITNIKDYNDNMLFVGDTVNFKIKPTMQIGGGTVVRDNKENKYAICNYYNEIINFDRVYNCKKVKFNSIKFLAFLGLALITIFILK